jgi:alanine racemase
MRTKRVIHTGAKTHAGGAKKGLARTEYQEPGPGVVTSDPRLPTIRQNRIAAASIGYDRIVIVLEDSMCCIIFLGYDNGIVRSCADKCWGVGRVHFILQYCSDEW